MADLFTVGLIIKAIDQASSVISGVTQRATQEFTSLQDRVRQVSDRLGQMGMASLGSGLMLAGALQRPVVAFMDLEAAATELQSALMKAGGNVAPEFERLNQLALELGNRLPGTTADFQAMMTMLIRQGISAQAVLGGMGEAAAYLGIQLKMPPAAAAEFVAKLQDATRTAEGDMLRMVDTIQRAFNLGVDPTNMLGAFTALGPAMDTIRLKGLEGANALAPLVAMLDQAGMVGSTAGIALEKIFRFGFDPKKMGDANAALKEFGVSLNFLNEQGEFAGLDNFFKQLDQLKNIPTAERIDALTEAFGQDAQTLQALTTIIDRGAAGYANMTAKMRDQADIQARVGAQLGTLRNLWEAFTGTVTNALAAVGALWGPELKQLAGWLNDLASAFQKLAAGPSAFDQKFAAMKGLAAQGAEWSGLIKTLTGVAAAIAAALVSFGALGLVLGGIGKALAVIIGGFALVGKTLALLAGPAQFLLTLGSWIVALARVLLTFAIPAVAAFGKALLALAMAHPVLAIITALAAAALYLWRNWNQVKTLFLNFWGAIQAKWSAFAAFVANLINTVRQTIVSGIQAAVAAVESLAGRMYQAGVNLINQLWEGIKAKTAAMLAYVKGIAGQIANYFVGQSPPPEGPLHWINRTRLMETLAESLQPSPVLDAAGRVAGAIMSALTLNPVITPTVAAAQPPEWVMPGGRVFDDRFQAMKGLTPPPAMAAPPSLPVAPRMESRLAAMPGVTPPPIRIMPMMSAPPTAAILGAAVDALRPALKGLASPSTLPVSPPWSAPTAAILGAAVDALLPAIKGLAAPPSLPVAPRMESRLAAMPRVTPPPIRVMPMMSAPPGGESASAQRGSAPGAAGGGAITLNYQPVINNAGGEDTGGLRSLLRQHSSELVRLLEEAQAQRARRRYV